MGLLDSTQESTDRALAVMASQPLDPIKPEPKHSAWSVIPRAIAAGAAEVGGNLMDTAGAFGQVAAASGGLTPGFYPDAERNRPASIKAAEKLTADGIDWRGEEGQVQYDYAQTLRPDPLTAGKAEQIVFGISKGLTKAVGASLLTGNVGGALVFGASEGLTTAEDLAREGVDQSTRTAVGAVAGVLNAAGMALPVAGNTIGKTLALAAAGGPASFIAQQAATRAILEGADYGALAQQYDPLDPVGLSIATLLPAGFGAWAMRGARAVKGGTKPQKSGTEPAFSATPDNVDAAMVQNLTIAQDAHDASPNLFVEPPVQEGFVRLYRGQPKGDFPPAVDWIEGQGVSEAGRWFSTDKSVTDFYSGKDGVVKFVDVPESLANDPDLRGGMYSETGRILPAEWANKAQVLADPLPAAAPQLAEPLAKDPHISSVLQRAEALKAEQPDMPVAIREDGTHATFGEEIEAIRRQAREGTDADFGADDAPLLQVAAECFLSLGS